MANPCKARAVAMVRIGKPATAAIGRDQLAQFDGIYSVTGLGQITGLIVAP
jgi:hypothetical protein